MAIKSLSKDDFKEKIFDYEGSQDWEFKGKLPAIIDFYTDWCAPCKSIAPVLEELSKEYEGRLDIYKIDTEKEAELSSLFSIQSIPTFLFIPLVGDPMIQKGAFPKDVFYEVIEERLLGKEIETDVPED